ncbi:MAG: 2-dehydro-3-deoxy-6-phosphogalactonate aldolase [Pseudomonadota bacterium]
MTTQTHSERSGWPNLKRNLVAILRGLKPDETAPIVEALCEAGFEAIEIPLNSPDPFQSIEIARKTAPSSCLIGAGTVLTTEQVQDLENAGGNLMVSPNVDPPVIAAASAKGMITMPGVFSPTEALAALAAGATALKFFPASVLGPSGIKAISAVLPPNTVIGAVGGVGDADFEAYAKVGISTFGLGSSIYKPGCSAEFVAKRAKTTISAYDHVYLTSR